MIQRLHRPQDELDISLGVDVVQHLPGDLREVPDVHVPIHHHDHLGEHGLSRPPDGVHHLPGMARVLLIDGHDHQIMEDPLERHVEVHHLGELFFHQGEEEAFDRRPHKAILLDRLAHDDGLVDGTPPVGDTGQVEDRKLVREGIEAGMIAERPFDA